MPGSTNRNKSKKTKTRTQRKGATVRGLGDDEAPPIATRDTLFSLHELVLPDPEELAEKGVVERESQDSFDEVIALTGAEVQAATPRARRRRRAPKTGAGPGEPEPADDSNLVTGEYAKALRRKVRKATPAPAAAGKESLALGSTHEISASEIERITELAERAKAAADKEKAASDHHDEDSQTSHVDRMQTNIWERKLNQARRSDPGGRVLVDNRYLLNEEVAGGGMARVFEVLHVDLGKTFALKLIHDNLSEDPAARKMFYREAQVTSALDHPNIVQVTDFGVDDHLGAFIVMEYLKGMTLRAHLRQAGGLPLHQGIPIVLQIAQALHYMHGQGLIHCDVKSENVFLCRPPEGERQRIHVKMIDFGLSKHAVRGVKLASVEVGGTPEYVAPEQIQGMAPQPSMDVYSLGILFYEVLTGRTPFSGSPQDLIFAHLNARPVPLSERMPEPLDEQVEQFVMRMIAKKPAERPSSMAQVIYQLRTLADMLGYAEPRRAKPPTGKSRAPVLDEAAEHRQAMVRYCPLPMFRVDEAGTLVAANAAFSEFVRESRSKIIGLSLNETRLRYIYPDVVRDVQEAAGRKSSKPLVRIVAFGGKRGAATVRIVIVPEPQNGGKRYLSGIIHPLEGEG